MRKRKSPRVVWLPNTNANSVSNGGGTNIDGNCQNFIVTVTGDPGDRAVGEIPIVQDAGGQDPLSAGDNSLSDLYNSGYRLRRIVGKIWVFAKQGGNATGPKAVEVTAAFIVRRVDPATGISLALTAGLSSNVDPNHIDNDSDPWIWKRSWIVCDKSSGGASQTFGNNAPTDNILFSGSALDGPHVDQKTARIVSSEERLFLSVGVEILESSGDPQVGMDVNIFADLRVLGSLRTTSGNRRNASR